VRPVNLPRSASSNGGAKIVDTPNLSAEEKKSKLSQNQLSKRKTGAKEHDPSSLRKSNRQSDVSLTSTEGSSGSLNDILTGLLNVVGEGLSIATNYVREENKRKKASQVYNYKLCYFIPSNPHLYHTFNCGCVKYNTILLLQASAASKLSSLISSKKVATPSRINANIAPSRINNRGPPRFTEIPFEAIPLEVLSSQTPGQKPIVQIQQRPFQTRFKIPKPTGVKTVNTLYEVILIFLSILYIVFH
jgi:hypothetical protein